jgi:hypothetical protein
MRPRLRIFCLFVAAAGVFGPLAALTQVGSPPTVGQIMPADIDPQSGFRLPLPKREDLDDAGKAHYDRVAAPSTRAPSIVTCVSRPVWLRACARSRS